MAFERRRRLVLTLVAAGASCVPPLQNGGVEVLPGAAERLAMVCRWRHGNVDVSNPCAAPEEKVAPARVRRIAAEADKLGGPLAAGRAGDYLIENDEIAVVVDQLGRGSGFAESGGNVVDAADAAGRRDELGQIFTYFGTFPRQAIYDAMDSGVDPKGTAWIEVRGHELYEDKLRVVTRYELVPGARALLVKTALVNEKGSPIEGLELGDAVQWGSAEKFAPGKEPGFRGDYSGPYIGAAGKGVAYAIVPASGEATLVSKNGTAWSNVSFARGVTLPAGGKASYARAFVVAPRGDTLGAATEVFYLLGGAPGGLEIELRDAAGAPVPPPPGGRILLRPAPAEGGSLPPSAPLWLQIGKEQGNPAAEAPPGKYLLHFDGAGRHDLGEVPITVEAGTIAKAKLPVSGAGSMALSLVEIAGGAPRHSPGKVQLFDATSGARVGAPLLVGSSGLVEIPAAPGSYRVVVSRGPEFALAEASVVVGEGQRASAALTLQRVVDTRGFIGCDLHQHSAPSADSGVSTRERILSNAAEGVECAVASEHNMIVDLGPIVQELGLAPFFRTIVGEELTSDASREPFGHANVFPFPLDPTDPRGGALPVRDRTAKEVFDAVLAVPGEHVIQVNHPRTQRTGYFDQGHLDAETGLGTAPGYDPRFDAVEVWSGRFTKERAKVLEDLWALLRTSHPTTPTANTDTHGIFNQEAGYPRTYIRVADDDPARLDPAMLVEGLRRRRDVVLTNGPFVTMRIGEIEQGGLVTAGKKKSVDVQVHVERAPWVDVTELWVSLGGGRASPIPLAGKPSPSGAIVDDVSVRFNLPGPGHADTFVVATVTGKKPLEPVLTGDPADLLPFAMTAPIWIDADGDGKALGR